MSMPRARILELIVDQETPAGLDLWPAIEARLNRPAVVHGSARWQHTGRRWWGALAGGLAVMILLMGTFALYPPTRAWAQETVGTVLAYFRISREPMVLPIPQERRVNPPAVPSAPEANASLLTREEAQARVSFPIKVPAYLPAGYRPGRAGEGSRFEYNAELQGVFWAAGKPSADPICDPQLNRISLSQAPASAQTGAETRIGNTPATPVVVAGTQGLWIKGIEAGGGTGYNADSSVRCVKQYRGNELIWELDGVRYRLLIDAGLGLDEATKIAESLR